MVLYSACASTSVLVSCPAHTDIPTRRALRAILKSVSGLPHYEVALFQTQLVPKVVADISVAVGRSLRCSSELAAAHVVPPVESENFRQAVDDFHSKRETVDEEDFGPNVVLRDVEELLYE